MRYDPEGVPFYPHKNHNDYSRNQYYDEELIQYELEKAVYHGVRGYDTVGISLSSGVDSVLLFGIIKKLFPEKRIVCINDVSSGESEAAEYVAKKFNAHFKSIKTDSIINEIPFYVELTGQPRWNVYHHHVWRTAKELGCDCLVTGDGADELFGGYVFRYSKMLKGYTYMECHINDWVDDQSDLFQKKINLRMPSKQPTIEETLMMDYNGKLLHDLLPTGNKIEKYYGIPTIKPYIDLKEIASHIPTEKFFNRDRTIGKLILRRISLYYNVPIGLNKIGYTRDFVTDWMHHRTDAKFDGFYDGSWDIYDEIINHDWVWKHRNETTDKRIINKFLQLYALECLLRMEKGGN